MGLEQPFPPVQNVPYQLQWGRCRFMQWHIQECPKASIQNNQHGCRSDNNILDLKVFTDYKATLLYFHDKCKLLLNSQPWNANNNSYPQLINSC